jgi:hypothetical protein
LKDVPVFAHRLRAGAWVIKFLLLGLHMERELE